MKKVNEMPALICPHFASKLDPETPLAYASANGRCYRSGKASSISVHHQNNYCLSGEHLTCPYFIKQQANNQPAAPGTKKVAPPPPPRIRNEPPPAVTQNARTGQVTPPAVIHGIKIRRVAIKPEPVLSAGSAPKPKSARWSKISLGLYGVLMMLALIAVLAWGASLAGASFSNVFTTRRTPATEIAEIQVPQPAQPAALHPATVIANEIIRSTTAADEATPESVQADTALLAEETATSILISPTQAPTDVCGPPFGWVRYVVQASETLSSLSRVYGVSVYQLQAANCMGASTLLYAGSTIYVPFYRPPNTATATTTSPTATPTKEIPLPTETATEEVTEEVTEEPTVQATPPAEETPIPSEEAATQPPGES